MGEQEGLEGLGELLRQQAGLQRPCLAVQAALVIMAGVGKQCSTDQDAGLVWALHESSMLCPHHMQTCPVMLTSEVRNAEMRAQLLMAAISSNL